MSEEQNAAKAENTAPALSDEQLQGAVNAILQNPAFGNLFKELGGESTPPSVTPEMMEKLPQMMAALSPLVRGAQAQPAGSVEKKEAGESEKRKKLLAALRPYLSDNRREAVDSILKVTEMTDLLGGLHLPGTGK